MAAAPVSNPGLDLSWLNLDEWGARAEPGKRGLTLDDLITYGDAPIDANPLMPTTLQETGLCDDGPCAVIKPGILAFAPQYTLYSDGATKRRWIALPPGEVIDTSDMDYWRFPVGTRLWKEFVRGGVRIGHRGSAGVGGRSRRRAGLGRSISESEEHRLARNFRDRREIAARQRIDIARLASPLMQRLEIFAVESLKLLAGHGCGRAQLACGQCGNGAAFAFEMFLDEGEAIGQPASRDAQAASSLCLIPSKSMLPGTSAVRSASAGASREIATSDRARIGPVAPVGA